MKTQSEIPSIGGAVRRSLLDSARSTRYVASLLAGMSFAATASGADWTGNTSTDWNTGTNWNTNLVPTGENAIVNIDGSGTNVSTISADIPVPVDIIVGTGTANVGRVDHTAGLAQTGNTNWAFFGTNAGTGIYNLADTGSVGGGLTGFAQGSGTFTTTGRLYVGGFNAGGATGTLNVNTTGAVNVSALMSVGSQGSTGVLNLESGTINQSNDYFRFGWEGSANGTLNMTGGTINKTGSNHFVFGDGAGGNGVGNISGGTINVNNEIWVGQNNATGELNFDGGAINNSSWVAVGRAGGTGTVNMTGGTWTKDGGGNFIVGASGPGTFTQSGGLVDVQTGITWIGEQNNAVAVLTLSGTAEFNTTQFSVGVNGGTDGTINFDGGTARIGSIVGGGGAETINFNGTQLIATGEAGVIFANLDTATIGAGHLLLDTDGNDVSADQDIDGTGGVVKSGAGTLNLAGAANNLSYTGDNTVSEGTLILPTDPFGADDSPGNVSVADGAAFGVAAQNPGDILIPTDVAFNGSTNGTGFVARMGDLGGTLPTDPLMQVSGVLTRDGTVTVDVTGSKFATGDLLLIRYDSTTVAGGGSFALGNLPNGVVASLVDDPDYFAVGDGAVYLDITSVALPEWVGTDGSVLSLVGDILIDDPVVVLADTTGISPGDTVTGPGIPAGTVVVSVDNATEVTLSANATETNGTADLLFAALPGSNDGVWDIATTSNWIDQVSELSSTYADPNPVLFGDRGLVNAVTLDVTVQPSEVVYNHGSTYSLTGTGAIDGSTGLLVQGSGTTTFTGIANTYDGVTRIEGGTLAVDNLANGGGASSIGDSSSDPANLDLAGGTLSYTGATTTTDRGLNVSGVSNLDTTNDLTLTGDITASGGALSKTGAGDLILSGDIERDLSNGGTVEVNGGTLELAGAGSQITNTSAGLYIGALPNVPAHVQLTSGELNVGTWIALGRGNGDSGTLSTFTAVDSTVNTGNFSTGFDAGLPNDSDQEVTITNTTLNNPGQTLFAESANATTTVLIDGTSVLNLGNSFRSAVGADTVVNLTLRDSASIVKGPGGYFSIGDRGNSEATFNLEDTANLEIQGGDYNVGDFDANAGDGFPTVGTLNITDNATTSASGNVFIGKNNGTEGYLNMDGGSFTANEWMAIGRFNGGIGEANISGGSLIQTNVNTAVIVGEEGNGTLNVSGTGVVDIAGQLRVAQAGGAIGTVNLSTGGTINTPVIVEPGGTGGISTVNFDGGSLVATADNADFISVDSVTLGVGGVTLDTQAFTVGIDQLLSGTGDLNKAGAGTLLLNASNSFTGTTNVDAGTLGGNGSLNGPLVVDATATLAPGTSAGTLTAGDTTIAGTYAYEIDDATGDSLVVNGNLDITGATLAITELTPGTAATYVVASYSGTLTGTFGSVTGLPAGYTLDYGTGSNSQITLTNPNADPFIGWIDGFYPGETDPLIVGKDADPDGDGQSNLVEFGLGGNPADGGDNAKVYLLTEDSDADGDTDVEALLTAAVRTGTPAFSAGAPSSTAAHDGVTYTVEGSLDLATFGETIDPASPVVTGLPAAPAGYEYRTFSLNGSNGLPDAGFLRVEVVETP